MNCIFDLYNTFTDNYLFSVLAILEIFFIMYIGSLFYKQRKSIEYLGISVAVSISIVPIADMFLFCYPPLIAFGRALLLGGIISLGYGIGGLLVRRKNRIGQTRELP